MTGPVSTLVEIGELARTRPALNAPVTVVADWYKRKAVVLQHIAAETGDHQAEQWSRLAYAHAARLTGRWVA